MKTKGQSLSGETSGQIGKIRGAVARLVWGGFVVAVLTSSGPARAGRRPEAVSEARLSGLTDAAQVTRDLNGIAHIQAGNEHDLFFMQGYVHAQDRLFQMDILRRLGSGTLAELLGEGALPTDVQLRTIGLRRAAERTLPVLSIRAQAAVGAYAKGVNAFAASNPLPPEYGALELTQFQPWTALDTVTVARLIAFDRSFDVDIDPTVTFLTYQQAGQALGFDGAALFQEDLFRAAPFDPASTVPDASVPAAASAAASTKGRGHGAHHGVPAHAGNLRPATLKLCREYLGEIKDLPEFHGLLHREKRPGSNGWAVSGRHTVTGRPLLANDTHLPLGIPSTLYPVHLQAGPVNATGNSFAGVPFVILGHNQFISWGATTHYMDVTDTFQEQVVPDATSPSGLSTVYQGQLEHVIPVPETFRKNNFDGVPDDLTVVPPSDAIPPVTLIVPRRNNGPIVKLDLTTGVALSVQYTGFSPTRELDTFLIWNEARNLEDFRRGLQFFNVGSLNLAYSDVHGNIAHFTSGDMPVREDLQAGVVNGLPPFFIRNGSGGNEWLPVQHLQPNQAVPYEILPADEMPHIVNPPAGWFVNCNNDPVGNTLDNDPLNQLRPGGGIYYLNHDYETLRAGRVTQVFRQKLANGGKVSFAEMERIQADTVLIDAQVFVPHILEAWARAQSSSEPALTAWAANPAVAEAVRRLGQWDFTTPTGIAQGYDASDVGGRLSAPSSGESAASVAATIYSVWRGQFLRNTLDAPLAAFGLPVVDDLHALPALRNLLERFPAANGVGASGLNFFNVPGVASAADRRDILVLKSLADSLALLSGTPFAPAFANSTNLDDYRWGKLHRIVLAHQLGGPFDIPPAGGLFPSPLPGLAGIPVDGGFGTVDAGLHNIRGGDSDAFMFDHGAAMRFVSEAGPGYVRAVSALPGGVSGVLGSPHYADLLPRWLSNEAFQLLFKTSDVRKSAESATVFAPAE